MKKLLILFLLSFVSTIGYNQYVIQGNVLDEREEGIPGCRVSIENSTYGVPTNMKGFYFLEVEKKGTYIITYSMIGFDSVTDTIEVKGKTTVHNVKLLESESTLNTVEIYADKRDIAKEVIGHVIDNKKKWANQFENYQCNTYIKTSLEKERRIPKFNQDPNAQPEQQGRQKMNFIESYSITRFKQNNTYKEEILAHHDYSDKSNSSVVVVSADFSDPDNIMPTQVIEYNPYIFFEKVQDGDFDLYQNLLDLPKISSRPIVSPVAINAFLNYKYYLKNIFYENDQKIYDIIVEPRFEHGPLFSGNLFIIDGVWVIKSLDLSINSTAMEFFKEFRIIQDFEEIDGKWVPVRREFIYTINDGADIVMANTRAQHTDYQFNLDFDNKTFKNVLMEYREDAFDKDSAYWENTRPLRLKPEELAFIREQDSIADILTSHEYIDSVNAEYNKITIWDIFLNGVGFRNREKRQEIYINSLITQPQPFGIGGYRHRLGGQYSKEFKNDQAIRFIGSADYGFGNNDLKGFADIHYTYLPRKFGQVKVRVGDTYEFLNNYESLLGTFSPSNYVRKTSFGLSQRYEIFNGLYGQLSYDYSTRRSTAGLQPNQFMYDLFDDVGLSEPPPFETYTVSLFELQLLYRFKQAYVIKGNKKQVVGTEYPELRFKYRRAIPDMFGSNVNYNHIEIGAYDEVTFATFGKLKWDVEAGSFLGSNVNDVKLVEHKFFRGSDFFFFSNPLNSQQLLDSTLHTPRPYLQIYAVHHFNGAIMSKIPLINKLRLELVVGGSALITEDENITVHGKYRHFELYGGIERKFKIRKQLFKFAVFYVLKDNGVPTESVQLNFKFGIDFFNTWTNSWTW